MHMVKDVAEASSQESFDVRAANNTAANYTAGKREFAWSWKVVNESRRCSTEHGQHDDYSNPSST
ncbi:hypothetical protein T265_10964 [Opisthorchis viverrini]|uniref:Uncharacterized protein n=1 Tax=Opisthorchis viverrini TaxID=6198 RepID=A0A074ZB93_OPIVI|nr:hypothetical protein T265_10964 [Opisthorchis viverrini]KER20495.1 hypothetical protein T265_10964 [Opisthorchis viverrini]